MTWMLMQLTNLVLSDNAFTGTLPASWHSDLPQVLLPTIGMFPFPVMTTDVGSASAL